MSEKLQIPARFMQSKESIWEEFIILAEEHQPTNLGQGFPDFPPPDHITKALESVATSSNSLVHQYTRGFGHPRLVNILAKLYSGLIDREVDPMSEIIIGAGAYEALFLSIHGFVNPGDEVILIEPYFDCYDAMIRAAGGVPVFIPLECKKPSSEDLSSKDWVLNKERFVRLFNPKTKMIIVNNPHNPVGKVYERDELLLIAEMCIKWNVVCLSDEVYEWLVYKPNVHTRICTLPGMWERTVTVGSAGKTFSVTGWKTGWAYGPAHLIRNLQIVHQNCVYTCTTPIQEALAQGFELELSRFGQPECYFQSLAKDLESKKNMLMDALKDIGLDPVAPDGGYFLLTNWSKLENKISISLETGECKDYKFAKWLTKNVGVQGIPPSAFYSPDHKHLAAHWIRFCFVKNDHIIEEAAKKLRSWRRTLDS